jgi:hypothetical protein
MPALAPPPASSPPPVNSKVPSYILWSIGGASMAVGTAFGIAALSDKKSYDDKPSYSKADTVHSDTVVSDVGLGLGVVLLVSGTVFYFMTDQDSSTAQQAKPESSPLASVSVEPIIGRRTQGGSITLRF